MGAPLRMALWQRGREGHFIERGQLVAHSDAAAQYTSLRFTDHLEIEEIPNLIRTVGDAHGSSLIESIIGAVQDRSHPHR